MESREQQTNRAGRVVGAALDCYQTMRQERDDARSEVERIKDERAKSLAMLAEHVGGVGCTEYQAEVDLEIASRIDTIKAINAEYSDCLQHLLSDVLYTPCEPVSHKWPGQKHTVAIVEAVEHLLAEVERLRAALKHVKLDHIQSYYCWQIADAALRGEEVGE